MIRTELQKTAMDTRHSSYSMANAPLNHQKDELPVFLVVLEPILREDARRRVIRSRCVTRGHHNALLSWSIKDLLNSQDK